MSDNENHFANIFFGALLGALLGAGLGYGSWFLIFDEPLFFWGDTILLGAIVCGALGFLFGEDFIEWLKDRWWWFW